MVKRKPNLRNSDDENALFRAVMADTKPLNGKSNRNEENSLDYSFSAIRQIPALKTPVEVRSNARLAKPLEVGTATDLDRRTMERLRKGKLRPDARLDLHGLTANHAYTALCDFLYRAHVTGMRCVLVITGKGSAQKGGGVIRRELSTWLNAPGNRPRILGFAKAQPNDGGGGAFYVLLKRRR